MSDFYAIPHCIASEMELLEQQVVMMYSRTQQLRIKSSGGSMDE